MNDNTPKSFNDFIAKNKAAMAAIDGGPAFPNAKLVEVRCPETGNPQDTYVVPVGGMTLRDYFAAMAMQAMIARVPGKRYDDPLMDSEPLNPDGTPFDEEGSVSEWDATLRWLPRSAYTMADAMIAAREERK